MTDITELAQREKFEAWFKSSFHPDKTGPYIKDQLYFAWKAAGTEMVEALEKAQQCIAELESRTVKLPPKVDSSNIPFAGHTWNCCLDEVEKRLAAAGIKWEAE